MTAVPLRSCSIQVNFVRVDVDFLRTSDVTNDDASVCVCVCVCVDSE